MPFDFNIFSSLSDFFFSFSWVLYIIPPFVLAFFIQDLYLFLNQTKFKKATDWAVIEIVIPRVILKGPKAMENFFRALYGLRNSAGSLKEKYMDGEVTRPFSLELASIGGRASFYMHIPRNLKMAVEAMIYSQYSDVQILDADDYVNLMPDSYAKMAQAGYEMFGTELALDKESPYPVATYSTFESKEGDARIVDSMALLLELCGRLSEDETVWVQFVAAPASDDWQKRGKEIVKEVREKEQKSGVDGKAATRTPGEELRMKLIEEKITKVGFTTMIRYMYMAPKATFNKGFASSALATYFSQFNTDTNKIKKNNATGLSTSWKAWPFVNLGQSGLDRKELMLYNYRKRAMPEETLFGKLFHSTFWYFGAFHHKTSVFSVEEMATMYHLPTDVVLTAPTMRRIESKSLPPPPNLVR